MSDATVAGWLDAFFAAFYASGPVDATFIGVHAHDWRLPDYSENGAGDVHAELNALLRQSQSLSAVAAASRMEAIDRRLAEGVLRLRLMEYESEHFHRGNPSLYTGEAVFGLLSLLLTEYSPLPARLAAATERLAGVPALLAQGRRNVRQAPLAWTERALRECAAARVLLERGIDRFFAERGVADARLRAAAGVAWRAFADYATYLDSELRHRPLRRWGVGEASFGLVLREAHCLTEDADAIAARAEAEATELAASLHAEARALGSADSGDVLARLADAHPPIDGYYARYAEVWREMRGAAEAAELLSWPDFPIRYVPRPVWVREAADNLYFLNYRSPAAFERPPEHDYLVPPIEAADAPARQQELLRATNDGVIKLNHVIHHGGIGHHVQNWHAYRSGSRIGQVAAVDCASRIAMTCGGTVAEGWACYATDLMAEAGALTPLEAYANRHAWLRMCARAVVDVRLHQGNFTLEQAEAYYRERAAMPAAAAHTEAVRNSMFPGAGMIYFVGASAIHRLRAELAARRGSSFALREFHDTFLAYGSIPVSLIAAEMLAEPATC